MKGFFQVESKALRVKTLELERFLRSGFPGRFERRKSRLIIEADKPGDVRLKLDRFLHAHHLTGYRVRIRNGTLEFARVPERSRGRLVTNPPSRAENTPAYFPGLSAFAATRFKTPYAYFRAKTPGDAKRSKRRR